MVEIYKRFDSSPNNLNNGQGHRNYPQNNNSHRENAQNGSAGGQRGTPSNSGHGQSLHNQMRGGGQKGNVQNNQGSQNQQTQQNNLHREHKPDNIRKEPKPQGIGGLLQKFLPDAVYDRNKKKIFGIFSAEDLLLVALIFLLLEKEEGDNSIMVLALLYILVSDYIDLPDLSL